MHEKPHAARHDVLRKSRARHTVVAILQEVFRGLRDLDHCGPRTGPAVCCTQFVVPGTDVHGPSRELHDVDRVHVCTNL